MMNGKQKFVKVIWLATAARGFPYNDAFCWCQLSDTKHYRAESSKFLKNFFLRFLVFQVLKFFLGLY